uniref:RNA helicase n=1 Tax=Colobus angolensis palliatus TaxID=336983 RepID=A0A2K5H9E3_COLAP
IGPRNLFLTNSPGSGNVCEDNPTWNRGFSKRGGNDLDPDECMQRTGGLFGSRRPALSGDGDTSQSRSGSRSERDSWKSEAEGGESSDTQGPKVTYIPPPPPEDEDSIFAHYQTGINFDKYDTILVEVSGHDAPPAILTFEEANLCQTLNNNIAKAGYTKLTPVQKYSIPIILAGRDLMACAQTGSGKTAAFLLPILAHMMHDGITASRFKELQEPECLIVAPTRELVNQIYLEIGLKQIKYLVLDEADRMLDMGFGPEMKKLISCPGMPSKEQRQTLMFSATFPEEIQRLAAEFLKSNYLFVAVGQVGGACRDVQQTVLQVGQFSKREKLVEILRNIGDERTMVFVETKKKADFIATFLCQEKISTTSIHGDREQKEREQALGDFRCGKCPVLVATSVAARGLDIENVQHVINFDLPSTIDEYVHRIGRTGRCGNTGRAISFFDLESDNHLAQPLVKVLTDAQQDVPAWLEEIAFSTYIPGFSGSTRGNVFASVDTRKGKSSLNTAGFSSSQAPNPVDDESWD